MPPEPSIDGSGPRYASIVCVFAYTHAWVHRQFPIDGNWRNIYCITYHNGFLSSQRICFCLHTKQPTKRPRILPVATAGASSNAEFCQCFYQIPAAIGCMHYSPFRDLLWNLRCLCRCETVVWSYMVSKEIGDCFCYSVGLCPGDWKLRLVSASNTPLPLYLELPPQGTRISIE